MTAPKAPGDTVLATAAALATALLWTFKIIGALISFTAWPIAILVLILSPLGGVDPGLTLGQWSLTALACVLWYPFYFRMLCPIQRWSSDAVISLSLGIPVAPGFIPLPRRGLGGVGDAVDHAIGQIGMNGVQIYPDDGGNHDLGQTGPLGRSTANQFGYGAKISVASNRRGTYCEWCGASAEGRRCRGCGSYLLPGGRMDRAGNARYRELIGDIPQPGLASRAADTIYPACPKCGRQSHAERRCRACGADLP